MTKRPRLLVIAKTPALHDRTGGGWRLFQALRALAAEVEIDFVATHHAMLNKEERRHRDELYYAVRDGNFRRERFEFVEENYFAALRGIGVNPLNQVGPRPLTLRPTNDYDLREVLGQKIYDLVWVETFYVADRYLEDIRRYQPWAIVYVDSGDLHYRRLERQARHLESSVAYVVNADQEKLPLADDHAQKIRDHFFYAAQVRIDETRVYRQADFVIAGSAADAREMAEVLPPEKVVVLPTLQAEGNAAAKPFGKRRDFLFVGNFDHNPNVTAAIFLKHEVMPRVSALSESCLKIVGNNPTYLVRTMARRGAAADRIRVLGHMPDLAPAYGSARVQLAPIFFHAGEVAKIGAGLAAGLPTVTTPLGAELMGLQHGVDCLVAEDGERFAAEATRLYEDENLWRAVREGALEAAGRFSYRHGAAAFRDSFFASFRLEDIRARQDRRAQPKRSREVTLPPARFRREAKPAISVILVTYNQWTVTDLCLRSLAHSQRRRGTPPFEVILVDNSSADGTAARARKVPGLRVIANSENLGFAAGNNVGIKAAKGADVVLLNNDCVVAPDWLARLARHARSVPGLGALGPSTNTERAQSLGLAAYNSVGEFFSYNEELGRRADGAWDVISKISGLCLYLPRNTLERVGLLDERYGIGYFEDDDYCLRVADAGLKLVRAKDVYVHHFGNMSFEGNSMNRNRILEKGMSRFLFKWGPRALAYMEENHRDTPLQFSTEKSKKGF